MINKTIGKHSYLSQNLSTILQPPWPIYSTYGKVPMASIHAPYISIKSTNSPLPMQRNNLTGWLQCTTTSTMTSNASTTNEVHFMLRQFNIDHWVLVNRQNLQVKAQNNKSLICKLLGPYKVVKAIGSNPYQFEHPEGTRWHNIVHTILLKPFRG